MHFDQSVHAKAPRFGDAGGRRLVVEHRQHDQDRVGAVDAGLRHLTHVDGKILAQDRPVEAAAHDREIEKRTAEIGRIGEHADRIGDIAISDSHFFRLVARRGALGRRSALHFHDEARPGARESRGQATGRRCGTGTQILKTDAVEARHDVDALARDNLAQDAPRQFGGIRHGLPPRKHAVAHRRRRCNRKRSS